MSKVLISIPDKILAEIDREAERRSSTRSAFMREAVMREIQRPDVDALDKAFAKATAAMEGVTPFNSEDVIREIRDSR